MHTSDQSPEEQPAAQPAESDTKTHEQSSADRQMSVEHVGASVDHEAIRQGRIYPPPPSFYQKEDRKESASASSPSIPLLAPQPLQARSSHYGNQENYLPPSHVDNTQTSPRVPYPSHHTFPVHSPTQGYPGSQAPYLAPPGPKKSHKWIWILVSILGVLILASCGICAWASSSLFGSAFQQATTVVYGGRDLTNNYYEAIQNKRYNQAYSYLSTQGELKNLTLAQYLKQAQSLDEQYGPVYKYVAGTPSVGYDPSGTNINHFTIQVDITREKKSYRVLLTMYKINDRWKITDYTTI